MENIDFVRCVLYNAHSGRALRDSVLTNYLFLPSVPSVGELIETIDAKGKPHRFVVKGVRYVTCDLTADERRSKTKEELRTRIEVLVQELPLDDTWPTL